MKVAFNRQIRRTPWGGGSQFLSAFADYLVAKGHDVVHRLEPGVDAIVMLDPRHEDGGFDVNQIADHKRRNPKVKVLHRVNDTGATRGGRELDMLIVNSNRKVADHTVYISEWVQDYYTDAVKNSTTDAGERLNRLLDWRARPATVITNGCDSTFFYPGASTYDGKRPTRLVTHHWSDNPMKGLDLYTVIDDLIGMGVPMEFTYVGRYPKGHVPKHTKVIPPLYGQALGDELRKHDVYVTAARWEACGSHHVEGAACGLPVIFHKEGGGVVEMCQRYGLGLNDVSEFQQSLTTLLENYDSFRRMVEMTDVTSTTMCQKYLDVLAKIVA